MDDCRYGPGSASPRPPSSAVSLVHRFAAGSAAAHLHGARFFRVPAARAGRGRPGLGARWRQDGWVSKAVSLTAFAAAGGLRPAGGAGRGLRAFAGGVAL